MGINVRIILTISANKDGLWINRVHQSDYLEMPIELVDVQHISEFIQERIEEIENELQTANSE